ncbi:UNVERIFIED_CONTAM: hypothetical protein PYX00_009468 [Menopon gallinae]|uniref:ATP synthase F0 subunit 6 n=1 Tax=Menopon gallinae TaxID=328185 RepID=A0AAW2HBR2_9NEOP
MPPRSEDPTSKVPLLVLGAVCLITVFMCQTRFKISKEIKPEVTPPLLKSNYVSIIYGFGKPDRFRLVLRMFIVATSPILSLTATGLLMAGKSKSNPYLFLPWMFVTLKGLFFVQSENMIGILKELFARINQTYSFFLEDWKWSCLYFTIFFFIIAESFAFYEVFEIFRSIWMKQYGDRGMEIAKMKQAVVKKSVSSTCMRSNTSLLSKIGEYHTITSICKFGLFSDEASDNSVSKLKSIVALFRKK